MKKLSLLMLMILIAVSAIAQNSDDKSVPPQVLNDFKAKFPAATKIKWVTDKSLTEVSFINDDSKMKMKYQNNGWLKTEWELKPDYTPQKVKDYVKQFYALYKIKVVYFTDNNMGERLYEVEIVKKKKDQLTLIFDISSNFLRLGTK
jgi:hypothetical protein